jgi:hypothetical protein
MHTPESIRRVDQIFVGRSIDLPECPGVYAFWWVAPRIDLFAANRHIVLKGPGERPVNVEYLDWWPEKLFYPCLYVGKTTNVRQRFSLHIKRNCPGRLHLFSGGANRCGFILRSWSRENPRTPPLQKAQGWGTRHPAYVRYDGPPPLDSLSPSYID